MGNEKKFNPIRPTLGRQLKLVASVLGTVRKFEANRKSDDIEKELGKLATQPFFKWNKLLEIRDHVFRLPFEYPAEWSWEEKKCERFVKRLFEAILEEAVRVNDDYPAEILDEQEVHRQYALFVAKELVSLVQEAFDDELGMRALSGNALKTAFDCLERKYGPLRDSIHDENRKIAGWYEGCHVPQMNDLFETLNPVIDEGDVRSREMLFVAEVVAKSKRRAEKLQVGSLLQECIESVLGNADASAFPEERKREIREKKEKLEKAFCDAGTEIKRLSEDGNRSDTWWKPPIEKFGGVCARLLKNKDAVERRKELLKALALIVDNDFEGALQRFSNVMPYMFYDADVRNVFFFPANKVRGYYRCYDVALCLGAYLGKRVFLKNMKAYGMVWGAFELQEDETATDDEMEKWRREWSNMFRDDKTDRLCAKKETNSRRNMELATAIERMNPLKALTEHGVQMMSDILNGVMAPLTETCENPELMRKCLLDGFRETQIVFDPEKGKKECADLMPRKRQDVDAALLESIGTGDERLVLELLGRGANVNFQERKNSPSPLFAAVSTLSLLRKQPINCSDIAGFLSMQSELPRSLLMLTQRVALTKVNEFASKYGVTFPDVCDWDVQDFSSTASAVCTDGRENLENIAAVALNGLYANAAGRITEDKMLRIAKVLLDKGADPNQEHLLPYRDGVKLKGFTPLMLAAQTNQLDLFKMMAEKGGDVEKEAKMLTEPYLKVNCRDIAHNFHAGEVEQYIDGRH